MSIASLDSQSEQHSLLRVKLMPERKFNFPPPRSSFLMAILERSNFTGLPSWLSFLCRHPASAGDDMIDMMMKSRTLNTDYVS